MNESQQIQKEIATFIGAAEVSEAEFNQLALRLFAYQFKHNTPYQHYCRKKGKTIRTVKSWEEIPAVPLNAFKELPLSCQNPAEAEAVFMTSGTTQGVKGKHYHMTLELYDQSMLLNFKQRFMKEKSRVHMGILFPTADELPHSSLAHYLALAKTQYGTKESRHLIDNNYIMLTETIEMLEKAEETGEPIALLGASYSFVHLLDELERLGRRFSLPTGSKLFDTGGFKNQSRAITADDFYEQLSELFGVERRYCINMYGMTELSTQFYDNGNERVPSVKSGPHWIRTRVVDPLTGKQVVDEPGLLVHCDLANVNSVSTILTEDIGIETEEGFQLLRRAEGAEARGCSIAMEELLAAAKKGAKND